MTMKPKAKKFRVRRPGPAPSQAAPSQAGPQAGPQAVRTTDAPKVAAGNAAHAGEINTAREMETSQNIDGIRKEELTGRQLRMARRMAVKNGLKPTSDLDAVRMLRARGIDPFQRSNIIELLANNGDNARGQDGQDGQDGQKGKKRQPKKIQLPQTVPVGTPNLPTTELSPAGRRAQDIKKIQRDISRRRRHKLFLLTTRLLFFVFFPTLLAGYYYYSVATPMYTTKSEFLILTADGGGGSMGGLGGLLPSQFATGQDSVATQSYLQSKDAMLRLDADEGFRAHFAQDWVDPIQRLDPDASHETAYKLYKKYVKLGYDPTEGVIRMEVSTAIPELSATFSRKLIEYAEERVDELSRRKREDAVVTAQKSLVGATEQRRAAQQRLVELQEGSILDPVGEIAGIRALISSVELRLQTKQLDLNIQLSNPRPNQIKVDALRGEIKVYQEELDRQNARLNQASDGQASLADLTSQIQIAQADLATADLVLQGALENKRLSEIEANKQVRYLTVSVRPIASEDPSYPRAFENTVLAFLIFSGIYLMLSLTVSILREQVTS
ncbi:Capsular polysaccharide export system inner membrane protein KpsE [hydrothermal vent metagenome]|uniref:Capsular polysaccharide export system inner membrane protein KpsE n=1 Tax=hydrothermal vent metagenome TaxID=652676 RepID=A0A3B0RH41_9ZZZZ